MANKKISELTVAAPLAGTELLPVSQGGVTKAIPLNTLPGMEIGYAERNTSSTTTELGITDALLMQNLITGLTVVVTGKGRPVEIEYFCALVAHTVLNGVVYAVLMINGSQVGGSASWTTVAKAGNAQGPMIAKRRMVLADGVQYTFQVGMSLDVAGTGTYFASDAAPQYLSVVQR